jgi:hypothetical protein
LSLDGALFTNTNSAVDMINGANPASTANGTFSVTNNDMTGVFGKAALIAIFNPGAGTQTGTISNNNIGQAAVAGSGCNAAGCDGIRITQQGGPGLLKATVTNNTIHHIQEGGIYCLGNAGAGTLSLLIQGNTVTDSDNLGGTATQPIHIESGASAGNTNFVCAVIGGATAAQKNTLSGTTWLAGIRLRNVTSPTSTLKLSGMGASTPAAYLPTVNNMSGAASTVTTFGTISDNGTPCP